MKTLSSFLVLIGVLSSLVACASPLPENNVKFGDGTAGDKFITANKGAGSANPKFKWDNAASLWKFSNDGTTFSAFSGGFSLNAQGSPVLTSTATLVPGNSISLSQVGTNITIAVSQNASEVWVEAGNGQGSTNTRIRRYSTIKTNVGTSITYADSATLGASFTINDTGLYAVSRFESGCGNNCAYGLSLNTSQPTTNIFAPANGYLQFLNNVQNGFSNSVSITLNLTSGDVIRPHDGSVIGLPDATDQGVSFRIARIK